MAIYNAYCDRVPVYIIAGNIVDATKRISAVEWAHSVQDAAAMVRDYLKWDDLPLSLPHFAESAVRADGQQTLVMVLHATTLDQKLDSVVMA